MNDVAVTALVALIVGAVAWVVGQQVGARKVQAQLSALLRGLRAGALPDPGQTFRGEIPLMRELRSLLAREWVPRRTEPTDPVRMALARIAAFLRHGVEAPLLEGLEAGGRKLRTAADAALDAVEDLEFFLEDPDVPVGSEAVSLAEVVQDAAREFTAQAQITVKLELPDAPLKARLGPEAFKDALFLILHNAGEFGGGKPVKVALSKDQGRARVLVRDLGPGFSAEALIRALDPFYSTSEGGLGLGLPHAVRLLKAQGGEVLLRNPQGGGAEVEISLPLA